MPRFSISRVMVAAALVAANCAVLQAVLPYHGAVDFLQILLVGLVPLFNAQIVALYFLATGYRISLRRRTPQDRVGSMPTFAAVTAVALCASIIACVAAQNAVMAYLEYAS
jgi:uncharacterized membrane protein